MQYYKIIHRTYYNYSSPVKLGPHSLRLRPREDYELRIESFFLNISPTAKLLWHRDVEGNSVAIADFDLTTRQLAIESEVIIQQYNETPLNFLVSDYAINFPFTYQAEDTILLSPYRVLPDRETLNILKQWTANVWQPGEKIQTYVLLKRLSDYIHQTFLYQVREEPGVQNAIQTLSFGSGSCRDFALLFMQTARYLGLAARFVSGYLYAPLMADTIGATHAWAEVYLPGAGWKGFDPTTGTIAGTDHIAIAVARLPEAVPPVEGSFTGSQDSSLDVGVWVSQI
jgi:transglutaminase-like putative cysteine protease